MKIVIIGAGNLAWHIAPKLKKLGHEIIGVYSRTKKSADLLSKRIGSDSFSDIERIPENADLYIVALHDKAIASIVRQLKFIPKFIAHTSGATPLSAFPVKFKNVGVFYPLQSFSKNRTVKFDSVPFLIESKNTKTKKVLSGLARQLSANVHFVSSEKRKRVHLAAVFANNFVNHMYSLSAEILQENQLSFDLLKPLIFETAAKIKENHPDKMQTGPARRNDQPVIKEHLKLLRGKKQRKDIYTLLNQSILDKFKVRN